MIRFSALQSLALTFLSMSMSVSHATGLNVAEADTTLGSFATLDQIYSGVDVGDRKGAACSVRISANASGHTVTIVSLDGSWQFAMRNADHSTRSDAERGEFFKLNTYNHTITAGDESVELAADVDIQSGGHSRSYWESIELHKSLVGLTSVEYGNWDWGNSKASAPWVKCTGLKPN